MRLGFMFALLLSLQVHAQTSGQARYVFKGTPPPFATKQMTFGLSEDQARRISSLTDGRVRLDQYFYVDRPAGDAFVSSVSGFSGVILPNVPPPVVINGDPELDTQWWIDKLKVKAAWELASGAGVTIADCDAGYYHDEADLKPNMLVGLRYDLANPLDPTVVNDGSFTYHGTAVAAIMIGVRDLLGTNGIAYNSKLVPLQNYNYDVNDRLDKEEATAKCVLHATATPGVRVIVLENQMHNGSSEAFAGTRDAVRLALQAGIIVVGAGGNAGLHLEEELKDDTGSIIVGALYQSGSTAGFSNYGARVSVAAFGENLHTLYGPSGRFGSFGGTSGATPQVAAAVALMLEVAPMLTPAQARQILEETRVASSGNSNVGGLLDVHAAVLKAKETPVDTGAYMDAWLFRQRLTSILMM